MNSEDKRVLLVSAEEEGRVSRRVLVWLNTFPEIPVDIIQYEYIQNTAPGMALSTIQGTYITQNDILGGYEAEYQFKVIYRIRPGNSMDKRLKADELLDRLGYWASSQLPDIGDGLITLQVEVTARSSLFAMYEDGNEDHQIFLKLTYKVPSRWEDHKISFEKR